ncbi:hypothetical protein BO86DRAFT_396587 [Aspergillus japonicus CBS 114.51]|uniref:Hydrophobin n=1 Tax=Aspergillus japonicus CBS 114.51 TaxID=1448312 RepID=A0A8T8XC07_ASPJA|nr:hypothetical protein BO86DRAFT_396587 [Aspergillus japonicus CBS 114.51]RAH84952.1 hypothetical protein BO86DRAFT_396587 [Aspergillus japonicus CBS 114.51]
MKFLPVVSFLLGTALAQGPNSGGSSSSSAGTGALCPAGLYGQPQCCGSDVLGLLDLNCTTPNPAPSDQTDFKDICSKAGKSAKCCVLPIASQDVLCQDA